METTAELQGKHYLLNGTKIFITSGSGSDIVMVMASTDRAKRGRGITCFYRGKGLEGILGGKKGG